MRLRGLHLAAQVRDSPKCLDNFASNRNVIQLTSAEFTGPLSFTQFWLDTIAAWEKESGKQVLTGLSCTKDVQDAILGDPTRSSQVDVIDIRYWTYTSNGELYAPLGGQSLSPRQHLRRLKPSASSFSSIVRAVRECRMQNPQKAVTYHADLYCRSGDDGWAVLVGGGSLPNLPKLPKALRKAVVRLLPSDQLKLADEQWCLAAGDREFLIYSARRDEPTIVQLPGRTYEYSSVDPKTGDVGEAKQVVGNRVEIPAELSISWIR